MYTLGPSVNFPFLWDRVASISGWPCGRKALWQFFMPAHRLKKERMHKKMCLRAYWVIVIAFHSRLQGQFLSECITENPLQVLLDALTPRRTSLKLGQVL
uniref:Hypothetical secreted protein 1344 n=1 Tax=Amblyomma variegatum TaxID=34610 RepID=F0J9V0_AMBVA|nr:TPA_inf: hypothetical secreted protein 1344 [Amblyomma variegatum]